MKFVLCIFTALEKWKTCLSLGGKFLSCKPLVEDTLNWWTCWSHWSSILLRFIFSLFLEKRHQVKKNTIFTMLKKNLIEYFFPFSRQMQQQQKRRRRRCRRRRCRRCVSVVIVVVVVVVVVGVGATGQTENKQQVCRGIDSTSLTKFYF